MSCFICINEATGIFYPFSVHHVALYIIFLHCSFIGGVYGRIVGLAMVSLFGIHATPGSYWAWMDPGAFALVGAASFFGGVSRLTVSLTVIMVINHENSSSYICLLYKLSFSC